KPELFDFIQVTPRNAGRKVRFHKDHTLSGMTTINLIYEYMDRFALAETLAYEVYRKAGNAACRTDFVRTWVDGRPLGFQLLIEQVVNYFAVNMLLSHCDGYFNNYFTYHDLRTGKWTMYPWDQDKTWGFHDGIRGYEVFFDMPVTFGMAGDVPPGWPKNQPPP